MKRDLRKADEEEKWREKVNNRDQWKEITKVDVGPTADCQVDHPHPCKRETRGIDYRGLHRLSTWVIRIILNPNQTILQPSGVTPIINQFIIMIIIIHGILSNVNM